jgi:hypothetical protein
MTIMVKMMIMMTTIKHECISGAIGGPMGTGGGKGKDTEGI